MRRLVLGVLSAVLLAALMWTGWWFYLEHRLSAGFDQWAAARRADGWTVTVRERHLAGWPATARLRLIDAVIDGGGPVLPVRLDWHAPELDLDLAPLSPAVLVMHPRGRQEVAAGGDPGLWAEGPLEIRLTLAQSSPSIPLSFAGRGLRIAPRAGGRPAVIARLTGNATVNPGAGADADAVSLDFATGRIDLPAGGSWPLGEFVQSSSGNIGVSGPVPPRGTPEQRARAWQAAGGNVTLREGGLHWGPLDAVVTGSGSLDAALQPSAEAVIHATGFAQAMDVLAAHKVMPEHAALAAKAVLSLIADAPAGGGQPVLTVPLSLRDGILAAHGIPLVRVRPMAWPTG